MTLKHEWWLVAIVTCDTHSMKSIDSIRSHIEAQVGVLVHFSKAHDILMFFSERPQGGQLAWWQHAGMSNGGSQGRSDHL